MTARAAISRRRAAVRSPWLWAVCVAGSSGLMASPVRAAPPVVQGAADARVLLGGSGRYGGAFSTDLWLSAGPLQLGGAVAVGAISRGAGSSSRVLTPVGLSVALSPVQDVSGPTMVARGGLVAGANQGGFTAGSWVSGALGYRFALGEGASVRVGADAWALFGRDRALFLAPYVGLGF